MSNEVRYKDGMKPSLVTHPGYKVEPSALPDGPMRRKSDRPAPTQSFESRARATNDAFNSLPRHEQIRLLEGMRIAWILDKMGLPHSPGNIAAVRGVVAAAAAERKPVTL